MGGAARARHGSRVVCAVGCRTTLLKYHGCVRADERVLAALEDLVRARRGASEGPRWDVICTGGCGDMEKAVAIARALGVPTGCVMDADTVLRGDSSVPARRWSNSVIRNLLWSEPLTRHVAVRIDGLMSEASDPLVVPEPVRRLLAEHDLFVWNVDIEAMFFGCGVPAFDASVPRWLPPSWREFASRELGVEFDDMRLEGFDGSAAAAEPQVLHADATPAGEAAAAVAAAEAAPPPPPPLDARAALTASLDTLLAAFAADEAHADDGASRRLRAAVRRVQTTASNFNRTFGPQSAPPPALRYAPLRVASHTRSHIHTHTRTHAHLHMHSHAQVRRRRGGRTQRVDTASTSRRRNMTGTVRAPARVPAACAVLNPSRLLMLVARRGGAR